MARSSGGANRKLPDVCFGSKADMAALFGDVRFTPNSGHRAVRLAMSALCQKRTCSVGGTSRRSARAALRLIVNSYLVGCSTGISAGLLRPDWRRS